MVYIFRCHRSSKWTSRETEVYFSRVKRSRLSAVIGRFQSIFVVSVFKGSFSVATIVNDGSEKPNHQFGFELHSSHGIERRNKEVANGKTQDLQKCQDPILKIQD